MATAQTMKTNRATCNISASPNDKPQNRRARVPAEQAHARVQTARIHPTAPAWEDLPALPGLFPAAGAKWIKSNSISLQSLVSLHDLVRKVCNFSGSCYRMWPALWNDRACTFRGHLNRGTAVPPAPQGERHD